MNKIKLVIAVLHADVEARRLRFGLLVEELRAQGANLFIHVDDELRGCDTPFRMLMSGACSVPDVTHVMFLPDDAILVDNFVEKFMRCLTENPYEIICCHVNQPGVPDGFSWYSTPDGITLFGGTMPVYLWKDWLEYGRTDLPPDASVGVWAMAHERLIYKPLPALVDHDLSVPSLVGNEAQNADQTIIRTSIGFKKDNDWKPGPIAHMPRTFRWLSSELLNSSDQMVERYWTIQRGRDRVKKDKSVFIATPAFMGNVQADFVGALINEFKFLSNFGYSVGWSHKDDPIIGRARNRLVADFLLSDAEWLVWWDADNWPTEPGAILKLIESGKEIVGGAVVKKDGTGKNFAIQIESALPKKDGLYVCRSVGTGFLAMKRWAVVKLCEVSPWYRTPQSCEWQLFVETVHDNLEFGEDYEISRKWRGLGHELFVEPSINFQHAGRAIFTGEFHKCIQEIEQVVNGQKEEARP